MEEKSHEAKESLARVQEFEPTTLERSEDLGAGLNFKDAIDPARRLVDLFNKIPPRILDELPVNHLSTIIGQSNQIYKIFEEIINFSTDIENPSNTRRALLNSLNSQYDSVFNAIFPYISFAAARVTDFQSLEREGRAAVQAISDETSKVKKSLEDDREAATQILAEVRQVAAEQGVQQHAIHFKNESESHQILADKWQKNTYYWAAGLIAFSLLSFFIHKIPFFAPSNVYDTIQLAISKAILFITIIYMLFLSAKNFHSHRHNSIVNKHRQNALATFKALVDAGQTKESRDIVLKHAAHSVFHPQETGYIRSGSGQGPSANTLVELSAQASEISQ